MTVCYRINCGNIDKGEKVLRCLKRQVMVVSVYTSEPFTEKCFSHEKLSGRRSSIKEVVGINA